MRSQTTPSKFPFLYVSKQKSEKLHSEAFHFFAVSVRLPAPADHTL